MSIEPTGAQDRHDQARAPGERPSFFEIVRGFGVMIGPSLLLDLFVAGSSLSFMAGRIVRSKKRLARLLRPLARAAALRRTALLPADLRDPSLRYGAKNASRS